MASSDKTSSSWKWIPTLYFAQGVPYFVLMTVAVIMYKTLGVSNTSIAFYTSWLLLPWVIKPFWSPIVDLLYSKRWWIVAMQLLIGAGLAGIAFLIPTPFYFQATLVVFWLMAFSAATHDIAIDGLFELEIPAERQTFFKGVRKAFYSLAMIACQGFLIIFAGAMERITGRVSFSWSITFFVIAGIFILLMLYHQLSLPKRSDDEYQALNRPENPFKTFWIAYGAFFKTKQLLLVLVFFQVYLLGQAMLLKLATPFLLDPIDLGGLGLSTEKVGLAYGAFGVIAFVLGGLVGRLAIYWKGLKFWMVPMALLITIPNVVYVYMSFMQPTDFLNIIIYIVIEQFGYGVGLAALLMFIMHIADGEHKAVHYALASGMMAFGMMWPGMLSGWLQEYVGYTMFFIIVMATTIPTVLVAALLKIDPTVGKKK